MKHLFWLINRAIYFLIKGNISAFVDSLFWIKIHLLYKNDKIK